MLREKVEVWFYILQSLHIRTDIRETEKKGDINLALKTGCYKITLQHGGGGFLNENNLLTSLES